MRKEDKIEPSSVGLADSLKKIGFDIERLRTGTPPRLDGNTIDYSELEAEGSDDYI